MPTILEHVRQAGANDAFERQAAAGKPFVLSRPMKASDLARVLLLDGSRLRIDMGTGVVWVVDEKGVLPKIKGLEKELIDEMASLHREDADEAEERDKPELADKWRAVIQDFRKKAKVDIKQVTSPKTKKKGWKITLTPTVDQVRKKVGG